MPVLVGLKVHAKTGKSSLVDSLADEGMSITYNRVLEILRIISNHVYVEYLERGIICPSQLQEHVFTTAATDNLDHNLTSATAQSSFHGTTISMLQYSAVPISFPPFRLNTTKAHRCTKLLLPESFTEIRPTPEVKKKLYGPFLWTGFNCLKARATSRRQFTFYHKVPRISWYSFYRPWEDERLSRPWSHPVVLNTGPLDWESSALTARPLLHEPPQHTSLIVTDNPTKSMLNEVYTWLAVLGKDPDKNKRIHFSAFYSNQAMSPIKNGSHLLPLIPEPVTAPATVRHAANIVHKITQKVNPDQISVITGDQPVYEIGKQLQ